mgnify:CR=1 FL=1
MALRVKSARCFGVLEQINCGFRIENNKMANQEINCSSTIRIPHSQIRNLVTPTDYGKDFEAGLLILEAAISLDRGCANGRATSV